MQNRHMQNRHMQDRHMQERDMQNRDMQKRDMQNRFTLKRLAERILVFPGEHETDRPNLYYIFGDRAAVAVDAGNSPAHVAAFYRELERAGFPLPESTFITHWHWDHTFGISAVHGKTVANELTRRKLAEVVRWSWTEEAMRRREESGEDIAFCNECIRKEYPDLSAISVKNADVGLTEETAVDLGGVSLLLCPRDSTHSRDALFVLVPEEHVLLLGDADCRDYYHGGGRDPDRLRDMLAFLKERDFDLCLFGHGAPSVKAELIADLERHL